MRRVAGQSTMSEVLLRLAAETTPPDTSDMPEVADWSRAERGRYFRPIKRQVTLRLDADLLDHFAKDGVGYQTRLNAALREWVEAKRRR